MNFDVSAYFRALGGLIKVVGITESVSDSAFCAAVENTARELFIVKAEIVIDSSVYCERIKLFDTLEKHRGLYESVTDNDSTNVKCILYTSCENESCTDEYKAGISTLTELIQMQMQKTLIKRKEAEKRKTDSTTGVYTREYFYEHIGKLYNDGTVEDYAVCSFSLKGIEEINKKFDARSGNLLMSAYVRKLQEIVGKYGMVSRDGGIRFSALFLKEKTETVMRYLEGQEITADSGKLRCFMSAYAGYYVSMENSSSTAELLDILDVALLNAKENPGLPYIIYDDKLQKQVNETKHIESIFQSAMEEEEFMVFYQPKVDLKTYTLTGCEALCRWKHNGDMILPFRFIPVLEKNGDICKLDFYMLEHVCMDMRRWIDRGGKAVRVSVNLSRLHMGNPGLLEHIISIIDKYNIPHQYIEIELTETTTEVDYIELKKLVTGLREAGIYTSVDDFGVGYSSMNLLRELPWNIIKIDRSFMPLGDDSKEDEKRKVMLKSVIAMTQALGLKCISEGVETVEQIIILKKFGCYSAQGYYFDKPLPVEDFEKRLFV